MSNKAKARDEIREALESNGARAVWDDFTPSLRSMYACEVLCGKRPQEIAKTIEGLARMQGGGTERDVRPGGSILDGTGEAYADLLDQAGPGGAFERMADPFGTGGW